MAQPSSQVSGAQCCLGKVEPKLMDHVVAVPLKFLVWGFLDQQSNGLQINAGVSDRLVGVIQGVIVLSVVIAYELVRRANIALEQRNVAAALAAEKAKTQRDAAEVSA